MSELEYDGPCDWPGCDHPATVLVASEGAWPDYAEAYRCRWHRTTPVVTPGDRVGGDSR